MSAPEDGISRSLPLSGNGGIKTLAIRLEPDVHAQLSLIAQLRGSTITDEIKTALTAHIELAKSATDLASRADEALAEIERDAAARREALGALFSQNSKPRTTRSTSGRKDTGSGTGP